MQEIKVPPTYEIVSKMRSPRTIKSHFPGKHLPPDVWNKKAKIVYVARNPKDVAVSYFHWHNTSAPVLKTYSAWETYFEDFISGKRKWNKTRDVVLSYTYTQANALIVR